MMLSTLVDQVSGENPFSHKDGTLAQFRVSSREEAVIRYKEWLLSQPELVAAVREELAGKDLICWCKPAACHGDVLIEIANKKEEVMRDFLGNAVEAGDVVLYGNDAGFITLAIVAEVKEDRLHVLKRGYRDSVVERDLLVPNNVLNVTDQVLKTNPTLSASPEEVDFILTEHAKFMASF